MDNKDEILKQLADKIKNKEISHEEILAHLEIKTEKPVNVENKKTAESHFSTKKMMYYIGAAIIVIGVGIFIQQIWDSISTVGHIAVTLGLGLILTASGSVLIKKKPKDGIGEIFHFIGGIFIPGGALVTLTEFNLLESWPLVLMFAVIVAYYLVLNKVDKNAVLTFFTIANGTALIYLLMNAFIGDAYQAMDIYVYLTMAVGASYILLAHAFREGWNKPLVGLMHFMGIVMVLSPAFFKVFDSVVWQILFLLIVIGGYYLSIYLKSRSILFMSTIFLITHVTYITSVYFAGSLGWPISLVLLGFVIIGLGYASITINTKFIKKIIPQSK